MYLKKDSVVFIGVLVFLVLIISATAGDISPTTGDISGKWIAPGPFNVSVVLVFKVDGPTLTGTLTFRPTEEIEIKNGKIKGNKISFYVERLIRQKKVKIQFKGTVVGNEINLTRSIDGDQTDMTAKREHPNSPTGEKPNRI